MESSPQSQPDFSKAFRWTAGVISIAGLLLVFFFQRINWAALISPELASGIKAFLINRAFRFMLNDILAVLLVASLFGKRKLVWIAVYVQLAGFVFILIPYVIFKVNFPSYNGPLISFLHRLVLNPLLIYLLIFFFWYQEKYKPGDRKLNG